MTEMKRTSIAIPSEMDERIFELKKTDRFVRCSYSEIVRTLIALGMEKEKTSADEHAS